MVRLINARVEIALPEGQTLTGPSVTRDVHIQQGTANLVYEQFGVEVENGFLLIDEVTALEYYAVGGRVCWDSFEYAIEGVKSWNHGLPTDHIEVLMRQIRQLETTTGSPAPR
ncbi:MAG: hypothetical protein E6Q97_10690 [Desulfurellales bacterium]|nr:MAG: hypothetical protein E6Q97_10690 [Desulfurellales bacterium]